MILIALGFVAGAWLLQQQAALPSLYWMPFILVPICFVAFLHYRKATPYIQHPFMMLTAMLIGFCYANFFAAERLKDALPKTWEQKSVEVIGVVATMPEVDARGERFHFHVEQVLTHDAKVPSNVALRYYQQHAWHQTSLVDDASMTLREGHFKVGERWQLTVRLKRPHANANPDGHDFEAWAFANNVRAAGTVRRKSGMQKLSDFVWRPKYMVEYCRAQVGQRISQVLSGQPYAGVVRGLVVGDDSQITRKDWDVYLATGTNHLMSISGLHITMLAGLAFSVVGFCWRRYPRLVMLLPTRQAATIGGALVALLYACLAGLSIPTQRTLYMLMTFAVMLLLSRRIPMSRVLAVALMVVVLLDPWAVIAPGFWLSFSAVAVITYASVNRLRIQHWLVTAIQTQWAVTLGLLPLLIVMFGQASIVSPVANAVAIPVISLLVVPLAILGALTPFDFILDTSQQVLEWCMVILNWLASAPFATWQQATPATWTFALAVIGVLCLLLPRGIPQRWLGFLLMLPMMVIEQPKLAQGEMKVTVLDVGQGLSTVVQTANHVMVYDTGQRYSQTSDAASQVVLPFLQQHGIQQIDALVLSHDDNDHNGGAATLLAVMPIQWLSSSYAMPDIQQKTFRCTAGQQWQWDGVYFQVLHPSPDSHQQEGIKDNNRSCVIKIISQHGTLLLTGDIEEEVEHTLLKTQRYQLISDVMVAPHHGSKTSSTDSFVQAVGAKHVIFTVGYLNRFKHPHPKVVSRYLTTGAEIYQSDKHGAITLHFSVEKPLTVTKARLANKKYWHDEYL